MRRTWPLRSHTGQQLIGYGTNDRERTEHVPYSSSERAQTSSRTAEPTFFTSLVLRYSSMCLTSQVFCTFQPSTVKTISPAEVSWKLLVTLLCRSNSTWQT